jgi:Tfp pilus assembly protein PilO
VTGQGSSLLRRVAREYRRVLVPLVVLLVVNALAYLVIVAPLARRVANIEQREASAQSDLAAAKREYDEANGTLTGKDRAARELETFYSSVLPANLTAARRLTSLRVPQLARQLDIAFDNRSTPVPDRRRDSELVRLTSEVGLAGRYDDLRTFVHQLETSPEFVVIDTIELEEGEEETGLLEVKLYLSTYYRAGEP